MKRVWNLLISVVILALEMLIATVAGGAFFPVVGGFASVAIGVFVFHLLTIGEDFLTR